jgi:hypothetical protein
MPSRQNFKTAERRDIVLIPPQKVGQDRTKISDVVDRSTIDGPNFRRNAILRTPNLSRHPIFSLPGRAKEPLRSTRVRLRLPGIYPLLPGGPLFGGATRKGKFVRPCRTAWLRVSGWLHISGWLYLSAGVTHPA